MIGTDYSNYGYTTYQYYDFGYLRDNSDNDEIMCIKGIYGHADANGIMSIGAHYGPHYYG